jgi:hypothetical protein
VVTWLLYIVSVSVYRGRFLLFHLYWMIVPWYHFIFRIKYFFTNMY